MIGLFNHATEELVKPDRLLEWCEHEGEQCAEKETDLWEERGVVVEAYRRYVALLEKNSLVDFATLQRSALRLLEDNPDVLASVRDQYQELLIDEYQDANAAQERLFRMIAQEGDRLTVVGDDDQSIYRFRGATVRNILTFADRYPDARTVRLTNNFRSRTPIVDGSLRVIENNPARYQKALKSTRGLGSDLLLIYEHTAAEEAAATVNQIERLKRAGYIQRWSDIAILLRSVRSNAEPYRQALSRKAVPYQVIGDASFFNREEIAQLYGLFSFLSASKAWGDRFLRVPLVGLGPGTEAALKAHKANLTESPPRGALRSLGV